MSFPLKFCICIFVLVMPVSGSHREMKNGDPNREELDWDWRTGNLIELYASMDGTNVKKIATRTPFFTHGCEVATHGDPDMYPEDGWVLVHRDFGIPEAAQAFPFFTLYNKYRGIFRIMIFNAANREGSFFLGQLHFLDRGSYKN